ncbi:MAG TPA: CrcB family protein [Acidimicrobiales bacterium]|nr:CrcB family protein [Acidimicrobiales bacterium]
MERTEALAIAAGGVVGATVRWAVGAVLDPATGWPWATFAVNLIGCALLGAVVGLVSGRPHARGRIAWQGFVGVGVCGGLTTFSAFAVEVAELVRDERVVLGAGYVVASLALGVLAAAGARAATAPGAR